MKHPSIPNDGKQKLQPHRSFWRSRTGTYLLVVLALGGLLLVIEHRVHILSGDWLLWLPLVICVGMHFFMHGSHGGHGGHGSGGDKQ